MDELLHFCECGCGLRVSKVGNKFRRGHNARKQDYWNRQIQQLCKCGCGGLALPGNDYINGHQSIGRSASPETIKKMSKAKKGIPYSENNKVLRFKEKEPLPQGYEINKESNMVINKSCAQYLGCYIAEQLLTKIFKNVQVMPFGNRGFDIICDKEYKIDIKSSATGYRNSWQFGIRKNTIANYFLCIAFEDRDNLNPVHLWLIPGKDINHKDGIQISKSTIQR